MELTELLLSEGDAEQRRLGQSLERSVHALDEAEAIEDVIAAIDEITADLDAIVENCVASGEGTGVPAGAGAVGGAVELYYEEPPAELTDIAQAFFSTVILIYAESEADALSAVEHFDSMANLLADAGQDLAFWDEHSLNEQRVYDIACLVYGSNPEAYASMVGPSLLPEERAQRCGAEFQQKSRAWDQLLGPYLVGEAGE